jgi:hypothetical protein
MAQVIQAKCPHCKNVLRMPAEWLGQTMRCKHCRQVFQAGATPPPAPVGRPAARAIVAAPVAPPPRGLVAAPVAPPPAAHGNLFAFDEDDGAAGASPSYRRRRSSWWKAPLVGFLLLGMVTGGALLTWHFQGKLGKRSESASEKKIAQGTTEPYRSSDPGSGRETPADSAERPPTAKEKGPRKGPPTGKDKGSTTKKEPRPVDPGPQVKGPKKGPAGTLFPRRALAISISDYWLANPLGYGRSQEAGFPGSSAYAVLRALGNFHMKFPNTQLTELSDQGLEPHAPLKPVIEGTITDFLSSSREQDRLVVLFAGHAVEDDKQAYLVPILGDLKDTKTLVPLAWLYDQLKNCKAREKVLILDVCRFDPARGHERPGSEKMGKVLDAQLQAPPAGVQVWSSCVAGQNAYETESGSVFLQALCAAMQERLPGFQEPNMPLPLDVLWKRVNSYMAKVLAPQKLEQTSRLTGQEKPGGAPYNPAEPLPMHTVVHAAPMPGGDAARPAMVQKILDEIALVPPPRAGRNTATDAFNVKALPTFAAKDLEKYDADYKSWAEFETKGDKFPVRAAVVKAAKALRESTTKFTMKEFFGGATTAAVKKAVFKEQAAPGKTILNLEDALDELVQAGEKRRKEKSKRWQANFDYVMARLKSRLIYVMEYDYVLAQIRSDNLPPLENGYSGYRLGSLKKITIPEGKVKAWAKETDKLWQKIINDYPDTPWALIARRERLTVLGLEWRPTRE